MSFGSQSTRPEPMPGASTSPTVPSVRPIGPFLGSAGGASSRHSRNGDGLGDFERCRGASDRRRDVLMSPRPSTTLADSFMPLLFADLSSAVWASRIWLLTNESDDGVAHGRQAGLRWWPVDFFSSRFGNAAVLQEGVSHHRHKNVTVKT